MHPLFKILLGALLMVGSVAVVIYSTRGDLVVLGITIPNLWVAFKTVVFGVLPAFIFLIGLFIVWLELDELRIERELKAQERRSKKRRR